MPSNHFMQLEANVLLLKPLLPALHPIGNYTDREKIDIRSFRVLSHAELEYYFENRCREIIHAYRSNSNPSASPSIQARLTTYFSIKNKEDYSPYLYNTNSVCTAYENIISKNHGIMEANLFKLLWPIGVDLIHLPTTLLPSLESYGQNRGALAHNGLHHTISFILNPVDEAAAINQIIVDIKSLDVVLDALLR